MMTSRSGMRGSPVQRCCLALLLLVCLGSWLRGDEPKGPVPKIDRAAARALAEKYQQGDQAAQKELRELGPDVVPLIRDLFSDEGAASLRRLIVGLASDALARSLVTEQDLRYHGQFDGLKVLGIEGEAAILDMFCDEDTSIAIRNRAAGALGDIGSERILPRLREVVEDFLRRVTCVTLLV